MPGAQDKLIKPSGIHSPGVNGHLQESPRMDLMFVLLRTETRSHSSEASAELPAILTLGTVPTDLTLLYH